MKKLFTILTLILLAGTVYAQPQQTITNEQSYAIINLEKAPCGNSGLYPKLISSFSASENVIQAPAIIFCINLSRLLILI